MAKKEHKKKICILMGGHFSKTIGGAQYQAKCITEELVKTGKYKITYLAREIDPKYVPTGYDIVKISDHRGVGKKSFIFDVIPLMRILNKIRPDIIYQRGLKAHTAIAAYYSKNNDCKLIFHVAHDNDVTPQKLIINKLRFPLDYMEKKLGEYGINNANYIIAQREYQAAALLRHYRRKVDAIIPNMHPVPREEDIEKSKKEISVLWVANFKKSKRPELFVRLAEEYTGRNDLKFIMVGRPGERNIYSGLHKRIEKLKNLKYLGECKIDEVNQIMSKADIFVNTSISEGFPNTFIQAWMRKVPVLSVDVDIDGVLDKYRIGFHVKNYEGLKTALGNLADDKKLRQEIGGRAQQYAFKHHTTANVKSIISLVENGNGTSKRA